ncbi:hypothetical protein L596_013736 [Steinernema carpocapsae]|uniref:F-box domain-containing protein n=1 Tax=Steinernema carpocapsae TaxID=34508 RepID=A0A4U5P1J5_STECR|nr:hypothetical protein L596_013736 [Steinernema carpocapsae]
MENLGDEDVLKMRKVCRFLKPIAEKTLMDRRGDAEPLKAILTVNDDHDRVCVKSTTINVDPSVIRAKDDLEDEDYIDVPFMAIDEINVYRSSDQRLADVAKVLKLPCAKKLRNVTLVVHCDFLSPAFLELLKILEEKPLEYLYINWGSKKDGLFWDEYQPSPSEEAISAATNAFDQLFEALRRTLTYISIEGPFSTAEFMRWINQEKVERVYFIPKHANRFVAGDPQARLELLPTLIEELKSTPREYHYNIFMWRVNRKGFDIVHKIQSTYDFRVATTHNDMCEFRVEMNDEPWTISVTIPRSYHVAYYFHVLSIECFRGW